MEIISFIIENLKDIKNFDTMKKLLNFPKISECLQNFCNLMKILYENKKLDSTKVNNIYDQNHD